MAVAQVCFYSSSITTVSYSSLTRCEICLYQNFSSFQPYLQVDGKEELLQLQLEVEKLFLTQDLVQTSVLNSSLTQKL